MCVDWHLAKSVFQKAIDQPKSSVHVFLDQFEMNDETRQHVVDLLTAHFEDASFLNVDAPWRDSNHSGMVEDPLVGLEFDNFVIQRRIGIGGMGAVYEAHQSNPNRQVAIKVLRSDSPIDAQMLTRFRTESEVLARLKHPGIAHVYASGTLPSAHRSQPWFAMELVDGFHLKEFLRVHELTVDQKIKLILKACDAVAHAHDKGVVHRDLKPANILVVADSKTDSPQLKIVDFGIARVSEKNHRAVTMTSTQDILGTINYLSPEQVHTEQRSVDHRCDVFALGVIAFESLTGRLPYDRQTGSLPKIIANIGSEELTPLRRLLPKSDRDLELIISKAIQPDCEQRYQSVEAFADDLRRYLANEPIQARPVSIGYRLKQYVRRNKVLVGGASTTILALTAGLVAYATIAEQAQKSAAAARYEADKAVAVNSYITNDLLTQLLLNVGKNNNSSESVESLVKDASLNVSTIFSEKPLHEAAVRNELGTIYYNLRLFEQASLEYESALILWEKGLGPEHPDTLKAVNNLAQSWLALSRGTDPETVAMATRAYESRLKVLGISDSATLRSMNNLAQIYRAIGRESDAETLYLSGINSARSQGNSDPRTELTLASNLGALYLSQKKYAQAINLQKTSYKSAKRRFGATHELTLDTGLRYATTLYRTEEFSQALELLDEILSQFEELENKQILIPALRLKGKTQFKGKLFDDATSTWNLALQLANLDPNQHNDTIRKIKRDLARAAHEKAK